MRLHQDPFIATLLILVIAASGTDLITDFNHGASSGHMLQEAVLLALAIIALAWLMLEYRRQKNTLHKLRQALAEAQTMPRIEDQQLIQARQQLGEVIQQQFQQWQLTGSEREIGMMLLKGYSLKEIAFLRERAEKTIRQQASAIYQKAGVTGRHAFSAWFIEDLL